MLLLDLNIDSVNAFLNIIPGEKLLSLGECLPSLLNKSVSIPEGEGQELKKFHIKVTISTNNQLTPELTK